MSKLFLIILPFILVTITFSSCSENDPVDFFSQKMPIVIEGWIEDEGLPVVIVTRATNLSNADGPLDNLVQRWCKVTVSDGTQYEVLPMRINTQYIPSVIYSANRLRGKVGYTYTLLVETETDTVTAITSIPPVARIDSLRVEHVEGSDSLFSIRTYASVDASKSRYYKIFTKVRGCDSRYYSSFLGTFSASEYDCTKGWNAARGIHNTFGGHFSPHYHSNDSVDVKLCTMDSVSYKFWQAYEATISLSDNMFFTVSKGCPSNIQGGVGYWAGYGTSMARIVIP